MEQKYDGIAKLLHWLTALVVIWATISGVYISVVDVSIETAHRIGFINVSLTTVFIPFFLWRLVHKIFFSRDVELDSDNTYYRLFVRAFHTLLYFLISVVLVSGVLMMDHDINVFNWFFIPRIIDNDVVNQQFSLLHIYSSRLLGLLVLLHVIAVLKHEITGKRVLRKML